jgi:hypothetical protein
VVFESRYSAPESTSGLGIQRSRWTGCEGERIVAGMDRATCALCGDEIDVGQAWMRADEEGVELVAHSGCVYRDETDPDRIARWQPTEGSHERS